MGRLDSRKAAQLEWLIVQAEAGVPVPLGGAEADGYIQRINGSIGGVGIGANFSIG